MKKMIAMLLLLCVMVMPFSVMAETAETEIDAINWEDVSSVIEAGEIEGDFYLMEALDLVIWIPAGLNAVDLTEEQIAEGVLYVWADENQECAVVVTAVNVEGATLEKTLEAAVASNMIDPEFVTINGLTAVSYKDAEANTGNVALVSEAGDIVNFAITPIEGEEAELAFSLIMASLMPKE